MQFVVLSASQDGSHVSLSDDLQRRHVARATSSAPSIGSALHGVSAAPGFALLSEPLTGKTYRVIFEEINSGRVPPADN